MTNPNQCRKKKKITYIASEEGAKKAEKALKRFGFDSKINFAKSLLMGRNTVTSFFTRKPIQLDSFKRICEALKLDWEKIAELETEDKDFERTKERRAEPILNTTEGLEAVQTITRIVVPIDEQGQEIKTAAVILEGDINSFKTDISVLSSVFQEKYPGSTLKVKTVKQGSIKIIIEGNQEDIEMLLSDFESGKLTKIEGYPVKDIQILSESAEDDESSEQKWRLVEEIRSNRVENRDLRGVDLSDADLSGAYLVRANLREADLSDCDLSDASLSGADLIDANLRGANLRGANLRGANLRGANLRGALRVTHTHSNLRSIDSKKKASTFTYRIMHSPGFYIGIVMSFALILMGYFLLRTR